MTLHSRPPDTCYIPQFPCDSRCTCRNGGRIKRSERALPYQRVSQLLQHFNHQVAIAASVLPAVLPSVLSICRMARGPRKQRGPKKPDVSLDLPWHELMPQGNISIGASLMDTIDDLINEGHIEPQLAMKILGNFDKIVQEVLADKARARLTFKVCLHLVACLREAA